MTWPTGVLVLLLILLWVEGRVLAGRATISLGKFFLAFSFGCLGATILTLVLQRAATLLWAPDYVAYTVGPPIEELAKALPLLVIAFVVRDGRRLSIADFTLLGLATGVGFEFVESNLLALSQGAAHVPAQVSAFVPGWRQTPGGIATAAGHPVWTALVGLACGVGVRLWPRRGAPWLFAGVALCWVSLDHALFNWTLIHGNGGPAPGSFGAFHALTLHGALELAALPALLLVAQWVEGRRGCRALGDRPDLLLALEGSRPRVLLEWVIVLQRLHLGRRPVLRTLGYFRHRRGFALAALASRDNSDDHDLAEHLRQLEDRLARERREVDDLNLQRDGWRLPPRGAVAAFFKRMRGSRWMLAFTIVTLLLFAIGPRVMPPAMARALYSAPVALGLGLVGLSFAVIRARAFRRQPKPDPVSDDGETLTAYRVRGFLVAASLASGTLAILGWLLPHVTYGPTLGIGFLIDPFTNFGKAGGNPNALLGLAAALAAGPKPDPCKGCRHRVDEGKRRLDELKNRELSTWIMLDRGKTAAMMNGYTVTDEDLNATPIDWKAKIPPGSRLTEKQVAAMSGGNRHSSYGDDWDPTDGPSPTTPQEAIQRLARTHNRAKRDHAAERAAQKKRRGALQACMKANGQADDSIDGLENELKNLKDDFDKKQQELKDLITKRMAEVTAYNAGFNSALRDVMSPIDSYLNNYGALKPDLQGLAKAHADMQHALEVAGALDAVLMFAQLMGLAPDPLMIAEKVGATLLGRLDESVRAGAWASKVSSSVVDAAKIETALADTAKFERAIADAQKFEAAAADARRLEAAATDARKLEATAADTGKAVDAGKAADAGKAGDAGKAAEAGKAEVKPVETKPVETKPTETKPTETKPTETKPTETTSTEPKPTETKPTETKPTETKPTETKPTETTSTEPKPSDGKPTETKPTETKPTETTGTEVKPSDGKSTETKPTETKPTETTGTEVKPSDGKPTETKPTETKPTEATGTEAKPAQSKSTETTGTEARPADAKPGDVKPADAKPTEAKLGEATATDAKPIELKPTEAKPTEATATEAKSTEAKPADVKPADAKPSETIPADAKPADVKPAEVTPADVKPVDAAPTDARPAEITPTEAKPAEAKPADVARSDTPTDVVSKDPVRSDTPTDVVSKDPVRSDTPTDVVSKDPVRGDTPTDVVKADASVAEAADVEPAAVSDVTAAVEQNAAAASAGTVDVEGEVAAVQRDLKQQGRGLGDRDTIEAAKAKAQAQVEKNAQLTQELEDWKNTFRKARADGLPIDEAWGEFKNDQKFIDKFLRRDVSELSIAQKEKLLSNLHSSSYLASEGLVARAIPSLVEEDIAAVRAARAEAEGLGVRVPQMETGSELEKMSNVDKRAALDSALKDLDTSLQRAVDEGRVIEAHSPDHELITKATVAGRAIEADASQARLVKGWDETVATLQRRYADPTFVRNLESGVVRYGAGAEWDAERQLQKVATPEEQALIRKLVGQQAAGDEELIANMMRKEIPPAGDPTLTKGLGDLAKGEPPVGGTGAIEQPVTGERWIPDQDVKTQVGNAERTEIQTTFKPPAAGDAATPRAVESAPARGADAAKGATEIGPPDSLRGANAKGGTEVGPPDALRGDAGPPQANPSRAQLEKESMQYRTDHPEARQDPTLPADHPDNLPPGTELTPEQLRNYKGMPLENQVGTQAVADRNNVNLPMRGTNADSAAQLEAGATPKPMDLKPKTVNAMDVKFSDGNLTNAEKGLVAHYEPKLDGKTINNSDPARRISFDDQNWKGLSIDEQRRFLNRDLDFRVQQGHMDEMEHKGLIRLEKNGIVTNTGLNPMERYMNKPFAGDHDLFEITRADGSPLPNNAEGNALRAKVQQELEAFGNGGHKDHLSWDYTKYEKVPGIDYSKADPAKGERRMHDMSFEIINESAPKAAGGGGKTLIEFRANQPPRVTYAEADAVLRARRIDGPPQ